MYGGVCLLLVFSVYWIYLTNARLLWMYLLIFTQHCLTCFVVLHLLLPVIYLIVVGFISKCSLSSILVLSISLLVFCSGCKIFQIFYSAAYLWSIGECLCALKLGWIQLCCFYLFFLFLSLSYPHRICLFVPIPLTLKWRYLCDLHLLYLVKLSLSVFEHSCVDILFAVFLHSIWVQVKWYSSLSLSFIESFWSYLSSPQKLMYHIIYICTPLVLVTYIR